MTNAYEKLVHLNGEGPTEEMRIINNFSTLQYEIWFTSGYSILIDADIFNQIRKKVEQKHWKEKTAKEESYAND